MKLQTIFTKLSFLNIEILLSFSYITASNFDKPSFYEFSSELYEKYYKKINFRLTVNLIYLRNI